MSACSAHSGSHGVFELDLNGCRLLKALSERLKKDAAEREAAKDFEIQQSEELPPSMRVMPSRDGQADSDPTE